MPFFPGIPYSHSIRFIVPSAFFIGLEGGEVRQQEVADLAMNPKGWSFLQHFLSSESRAWAIPDILARSLSEIGLRLKDRKLENRF